MQRGGVAKVGFAVCTVCMIAALGVGGLALHPAGAGVREHVRLMTKHAIKVTDKAVKRAEKIAMSTEWTAGSVAEATNNLAALVNAEIKVDKAIKDAADEEVTASGDEKTKVEAVEKSLVAEKASIAAAMASTALVVERDIAIAHGHPLLLNEHGEPRARGSKKVHKLAQKLSALAFAVDAANDKILKQSKLIAQLPDDAGPDKENALAVIEQSRKKVKELEKMQKDAVKSIKTAAFDESVGFDENIGSHTKKLSGVPLGDILKQALRGGGSVSRR